LLGTNSSSSLAATPSSSSSSSLDAAPSGDAPPAAAPAAPASPFGAADDYALGGMIYSILISVNSTTSLLTPNI